MAKLLYIESSPRKKRSASIEISHIFLDDYRQTHPDDEVEVLDLWQLHMPEFDGDVIDAKYAILHNQSHTEAQRKAWRDVETIIDQFKSADKYVFSIPMWNFGIPYKLKHYIDILVQPSYTFAYSDKGFSGLVNNKPAYLILARGGSYGSGTGAEGYDIQKKYMETILGFIGFKDIRTILVEPTTNGEEKKRTALEKAKTQANESAAKF